MNANKLKGHAAVLTANVIFGLNIPITKFLLSGWMSPLGYMLSRTVVATLFFWTASLFAPKEKVGARDLLLIAAGGFLGFIVSQYLTALSLQYTTPVHFSLIVALSPVIVMLLAALLLHEPISRQKVAGVALGIAGALLLVVRSMGTESGRNDLMGILLAVLSITGYGLYLIIVRSIAQKYTVVTQMKWLFLFTALMMLPFGARDFCSQAVFSAAATWQAVAGLTFVILFSTMLGYLLTPYGLKNLRATTVSIYMNLQPIVASVVAIFVGQDVFSWDKPIAAVLVIAGAYVVTTSRAKVSEEGANSQSE